jgi:hypothetical protein
MRLKKNNVFAKNQLKESKSKEQKASISKMHIVHKHRTLKKMEKQSAESIKKQNAHCTKT